MLSSQDASVVEIRVMSQVECRSITSDRVLEGETLIFCGCGRETELATEGG